MIVRLKVKVQRVNNAVISCFNSMIVRLKVPLPEGWIMLSNGSFNSMIVRLKVIFYKIPSKHLS